jgi:large subunit ribosomal protein L20
MARVKRGISAHKRRKNLLEHTKGFRWGRKSKFKMAKEGILHAWTNAYSDRKKKKRVNRNLWLIKINAACRAQGLAYNQFIFKLKSKKIELDRKALSDLAQNNPDIFNKILEELK